MTGLPSLQSLAQVFTERMLNGVLESAALVIVAYLLLKGIGRKSSSTRFAVWFVVLVATVFLPVVESFFSRSSAVAAATPEAAVLIPSSWAAYLFGAWSVITVGLLGRVALGLWQIHCLRRNCVLMDGASFDPVLRLEISASCRRPVEFYVSHSLRVPMASGFFRPMIVIPAWAVGELSSDELKVVLLHEAAHLRRRDDWTNLAQKILRAIFFFHPVVWWIEGKLSIEREMACDDMVVAATSSPRAYAACLINLAEKSLGRRSLAFAQAAVNRMRHTSLRIREILSGNRPATIRIWKPAVGVAIASALVCFVSLPEAPHLVAFRSPSIGTRADVATPVFAPPATSNPFLKMATFSKPPARARVRPTPSQRAITVDSQVRSQEVAASQTSNALSNDQAVQVVPARLNVDDLSNYRGVSVSTSEAVFVVMRSQQIDAAGDKVFHISVYRMTVFYPSFYPGNPQKTPTKSI